MPLNTIGYMVVILLLIIVILMMTTRSADGLFGLVDEKITDPAEKN
ncbi:MAG: hypothetical protein JW705_03660 [Methanosarcinaceae archaeon]|nr:hypothetical protein [Methanosarcinaceae archaeon]